MMIEQTIEKAIELGYEHALSSNPMPSQEELDLLWDTAHLQSVHRLSFNLHSNSEQNQSSCVTSPEDTTDQDKFRDNGTTMDDIVWTHTLAPAELQHYYRLVSADLSPADRLSDVSTHADQMHDVQADKDPEDDHRSLEEQNAIQDDVYFIDDKSYSGSDADQMHDVQAYEDLEDDHRSLEEQNAIPDDVHFSDDEGYSGSDDSDAHAQSPQHSLHNFESSPLEEEASPAPIQPPANIRYRFQEQQTRYSKSSPEYRANANGRTAARRGYNMMSADKLLIRYPTPELREIYTSAYWSVCQGEEIHRQRKEAEKNRVNQVQAQRHSGYQMGRDDAMRGRTEIPTLEELKRRFSNVDDNFRNNYIRGFESTNLSVEDKAERRKRQKRYFAKHIAKTRTPKKVAERAAKRRAQNGCDLPSASYLRAKYPDRDIMNAYIECFVEHELAEPIKSIKHENYKRMCLDRGKQWQRNKRNPQDQATYTPQHDKSSSEHSMQSQPPIESPQMGGDPSKAKSN